MGTCRTKRCLASAVGVRLPVETSHTLSCVPGYAANQGLCRDLTHLLTLLRTTKSRGDCELEGEQVFCYGSECGVQCTGIARYSGVGKLKSLGPLLVLVPPSATAVRLHVTRCWGLDTKHLI